MFTDRLQWGKEGINHTYRLNSKPSECSRKSIGKHRSFQRVTGNFKNS